MKLSDVCFEMHQGINTVADKVKYYECGTPILQSKNITNGILDLEDVRFVNENDYNKYKEKYIPHKGNILLSNIGTIGKSLLIEEEKNFLIAWNIFLIKVNESKINSKFLNFYFQYLDMSNYYNKYLTGGTVKFINKKTMENIEIPNISLVNQIEIANKLEKVQKMIDIRKKQIEELDELIKSQFVEMFEEKEFPKIAIKDFADVRAGGTPDRKNKTYWENGNIPWIKTGEVKENLIVESEEYITELGLENSSAVLFDVGTILVAMYGQGVTRGRCAKLGIKATTNQACAGINIYDNKVINDYLFYYLQIKYEELRNLGLGGVQPNLNSKMIKEFEVILPPIELQNDFVKKIKLIDKQKFEIQKSLEEMQKLQESLMNKYFG